MLKVPSSEIQRCHNVVTTFSDAATKEKLKPNVVPTSCTSWVRMKITTPKNSTKCSNYIRIVAIKDEEIMLLFNRTYLYTNIPVTNTSNIFKDYLNNNDIFTRKTTLKTQNTPWYKFLDLVKMILTTIWYIFNSLCLPTNQWHCNRRASRHNHREVFIKIH